VTDRAIYHITHVENLAGMIHEGRLWCDVQRLSRNLVNTNIGYSHIKERRMRHPVTVAAGGTLGNYVPFNFCPRSVMLYVVAQGHEHYSSGQRPIVHLVSSIQVVLATGRPWFFTDRHADLGYASLFGTLDRLDEVDWSVMPRKYWSDPDVQEKRQAEFLVHDWFRWSAIAVFGAQAHWIKSITSCN
jgi:ssDNA thymidine ADP-ribosyltransferase DarT-like protein